MSPRLEELLRIKEEEGHVVASYKNALRKTIQQYLGGLWNQTEFTERATASYRAMKNYYSYEQLPWEFPPLEDLLRDCQA